MTENNNNQSNHSASLLAASLVQPNRNDFAPGLTLAFVEISQVVNFVELAIDLTARKSFLDDINSMSGMVHMSGMAPAQMPKSQTQHNLDAIEARLKNNNLWLDMAGLSENKMSAHSVEVLTRMRTTLENAKVGEEDLEEALFLVVSNLDEEIDEILSMLLNP